MVVDATGQALAHVYFEEERGRRAAAHLLTRDEARRIAAKPLKARKYAAGTGNGQALAYVKFQRHS